MLLTKTNINSIMASLSFIGLRDIKNEKRPAITISIPTREAGLRLREKIERVRVCQISKSATRKITNPKRMVVR